MNRRSFIGSIAAFLAVPFVKAESKPTPLSVESLYGPARVALEERLVAFGGPDGDLPPDVSEHLINTVRQGDDRHVYCEQCKTWLFWTSEPMLSFTQTCGACAALNGRYEGKQWSIAKPMKPGDVNPKHRLLIFLSYGVDGHACWGSMGRFEDPQSALADYQKMNSRRIPGEI
jgi:hypothetical protein